MKAPLAGIATLALWPMAAHAGLEICNDTDKEQSVAIAHLLDGTWTSEGWWNIQPDDCAMPLDGDLKNRYYYYRAEAAGDTFEDEGIYFCTESEAFTIEGQGDCDSRGHGEDGFRKIDTGTTATHFTLTLMPPEAHEGDGERKIREPAAEEVPDDRKTPEPEAAVAPEERKTPEHDTTVAPEERKTPEHDTTVAPEEGKTPETDTVVASGERKTPERETGEERSTERGITRRTQIGPERWESGYRQGSAGEPFEQMAVFQGCDVFDGAKYCAFHAEGVKWYAYYGGLTPTAFLERLQTLDQGTNVKIEGDVINLGDITVEMALSKVTLRPGSNPYQAEYDALQGAWISADDPSYRLEVVGNEMYETHGSRTEQGFYWRFAESCDDAPPGVDFVLIKTEPETQEQLCYMPSRITKDRMELVYAGRGNTLTFRRP